jgi:high-affinity nickel permease
MRDFFIRALEMVINVVVVIAAIGIVVGAVVTMIGGPMLHEQGGLSGVLAGLLVLVVGFLNLTLMAGFVYLGLGIYQNTKRTAEALEAHRLS